MYGSQRFFDSKMDRDSSFHEIFSPSTIEEIGEGLFIFLLFGLVLTSPYYVYTFGNPSSTKLELNKTNSTEVYLTLISKSNKPEDEKNLKSESDTTPPPVQPSINKKAKSENLGSQLPSEVKEPKPTTKAEKRLLNEAQLVLSKEMKPESIPLTPSEILFAPSNKKNDEPFQPNGTIFDSDLADDLVTQKS